MLRFEDIRFDCALYNGYKPCVHGNECAACAYYQPIPPPPGSTQSEPVTADCSGPVTSILIIKTGAMGDVLRTTTILAPLERAYPSAAITWVTDRSAVPLLAANPMISEVIPFGETGVRKVCNRRFDLLLNYEKEKEPLDLAGLVQAGCKRGFAPTPWNTPTVYNSGSQYALLLGLSDELKFRVNRKSYPRVICEMAELEYRRDPYVLHLTEAGRARSAEVNGQVRSPGRPRVGINTGVGAVFRTKQWTPEGWVGLADVLHDQADANLLLLGGRAESELNRQIIERSGCAPDGPPLLLDTGCDNSLEQFIGVVNACDVLVTADSLAMHISVALGKRTVAIFGSTSDHEIDLYDRGEKVVTDFPCSPCYRKTCDKTPTCMQALTPDIVARAVLGQLASAERGDQ